MNEEERKKYNEISKLVNGLCTRNDVSNKLDISLRQVDRLKKNSKKKGKRDLFIKIEEG